MEDRRSLGRLAREPLYNTRAVVRMTEVPADTFRAWERRYGVPRPHRTSGNQRLYSDLDVGAIRWLRDRTDEGMTISNAVRRLTLEVPAILADDQADDAPVQREHAPDTSTSLRGRLLDALTTFDGATADRVLDEAVGLYSIEAFCEWIIEPVMIEIGDRWSRNEVSVAVEHFATNLMTRRLESIFAGVALAEGRGTIIAACPAGETHDLGLRIIAIMLSRRGWEVIYLGANMPADDLVWAISETAPDLVCLSASRTDTVTEAISVVTSLRQQMTEPPIMALGGQAVTEGLGVLRDAGITPIRGSGIVAVEQIVAALDAVMEISVSAA